MKIIVLALVLLLEVPESDAALVPHLAKIEWSASGISCSYSWDLDGRRLTLQLIKRHPDELFWVLRFVGNIDGKPYSYGDEVWDKKDGEVPLDVFLPILLGTLQRFQSDNPEHRVGDVSIEMHKIVDVWEEFLGWLDKTAQSVGTDSLERDGRFNSLYRQFVHESVSIKKISEFLRRNGYQATVRGLWYESEIAWKASAAVVREKPQKDLCRYLARPGGFGLDLK